MKKQENHTDIQIRQSNIITNSRHDLSAVQLDLYFMMLSLLRENDEHGKIYEIHINKIEEITGRKWNYKQLLEATKSMIGKVFEIDKPDSILQVAMLSSAEYLKGLGTIRLSIDPKLRPYLIDIKNNFTSFQLHSVLCLTSKYAKWMYMHFSRWKDIGFVSFEIIKLRILLNLKEQYPQWCDLKNRIIEPSIKLINASTDLKISYELEKKSRAFHSINFTIIPVYKNYKIIPFEINEEDKEAILLKNKMYMIGIQDEKLVNIVLETIEMRKKAHKWFYDYSFKKDSIKSPAGHFRTAMGI